MNKKNDGNLLVARSFVAGWLVLFNGMGRKQPGGERQRRDAGGIRAWSDHSRCRCSQCPGHVNRLGRRHAGHVERVSFQRAGDRYRKLHRHQGGSG